MGDLSTAGTEHAQITDGGQPAWPNAGLRVVRENGHRANDAAISREPRRDWGRSDCGPGHYAEVFDIINCGPRRRFVVKGVDGQPLIVHNCENITQAAANDVLRASLRQLDGVVLHVHDEIVLEVPEDAADAAKARLHDVMCAPPAWAQGLPLQAEVNVMIRYGK
jgi:hypothetical protein